jgi:hypothetical protein
MRLTTLNFENAKPKEKPQKLIDGNGLYPYEPAALASAHPGASRTTRQFHNSWRYDFRFDKDQQTPQ